MRRIIFVGLILSAVGGIALAQVSPTQKEPASAAKPAATPMQQKMSSMQELMEKIEKTKDPAERERLLAQHGKDMLELMGAMKNMGCGVGGSGMMGGEGGKAAPGAGEMSHGQMSRGQMGQGQMGQGQMSQGMMSNQGMMSGAMMQCHQTMMSMMEQMIRHEVAHDSAAK